MTHYEFLDENSEEDWHPGPHIEIYGSALTDGVRPLTGERTVLRVFSLYGGFVFNHAKIF